MTWSQAVLVYVVCWWLLLFMALPIGVARLSDPAPGQEPAAPEKPRLAIKCFWVTIIAAFVTWGIDLIIHSGIVTVR